MNQARLESGDWLGKWTMRLQLDMAPTVGRTKGPFRLPPPATLHHWISGPTSPAQPSPPCLLCLLALLGPAWASPANCQLPSPAFSPLSHPITEMRPSVAHLSHRLTILWKD